MLMANQLSLLHKTKKMAENTRSSANADGPHDMPQIRNIALEKLCNRGMTLNDAQDHYNCCY